MGFDSTFLGRGNTMLDIKDWNLNGQRFGKLELVDREIFFISFKDYSSKKNSP